ncbi:MAG: leucine-rich repeat protein [Candidatus Azobacteroides sp.]|nr:leucine-rich repeat protein [Candidatus Azobacteroides sp.]
MRLRSIFFFLVIFCSKTVFADFYDNKTGILFRDSGGGNCTAVGYHYNGSFIGSIANFGGDVIMPSVVTNNGVNYTVTGIADNAFRNADQLKSIKIPESITEIGAFAFFNCVKLAFIDISKKVVYIGDGAFAGGGVLTSINVAEDNLSYMSEDGVLYNKSKTELHTYPLGKRDSLFSIPSTVRAIRADAFYYCKPLSIDIPNSVESIGDYAFQGNASKDIFVYWNTPLTVPLNLFMSANISAATLHVPCGTKELYQAANVWKDFGMIKEDEGDCTGGFDAFIDLSTSSLNFTGSGEQKTFMINSNTTWTINCDASWLTISPTTGSGGMLGSATTVSVTAAVNPTTTQRTATITVHMTADAFKTITVTQAAGSPALSVSPTALSFAASGEQKSFSITSNTNWTAGSNADWLTVSPTSGSNNGTVTATATANTATTQRTATITVSGTGVAAQTINVTQAAAQSGGGQTWNLTPTMTATLDSNGVLTISTTASSEAMPNFSYSSAPSSAPWYDVRYNIMSVVIKDKVTSIGDYAFLHCSGMNSIMIPNTLTSIGHVVFANCGLDSITIPYSVTNIETNSFGPNSLTSIRVDAGNTTYSSDNGILYNKNKTTLHTYPGGKSGSFTIPNSVSTIGGQAFFACNLSAITISNNVTTIEMGAFAYCSKLTSVSIPNSVTSIGNAVFQNCTGLKDITVAWATPLYVDNYTFSGTNTSAATLHVPAGTKALYQAANVWKDFGTIIDDGAPVTIAVTGISLNKQSLSLEIDSAEQLTATVLPENATNKNYTWRTSDSNVATVVNGLVTAVSEGNATITVTTEDGGFTATCRVTVNPKTPEPIAVTGVELDKTSVSLKIGNSEQLTATVLPTDADNKKVRWSSSDTTVVTVSAIGLIFATGQGTATVTVTTEDGGFTAKCNVEVTGSPDVEVEEEQPVGDNGKGKIVLSLTIPANSLFSGSFLLTLPTGVHLDLTVTQLADTLQSSLSLTIVQNAGGNWLFTITPLTLRSGSEETVYSRIVEIGYAVDETVTTGTYDALISDLSFNFDNGTTIGDEELPVTITVNNTITGIPELSANISAYMNNDRLYIQSPIAETVRIYSTNGVLLYHIQKPAGIVHYPINQLKGTVLIVKGSSGWTKKVIR